MKTPKINKKLNLKKVTVSNLDSTQMNDVRGGLPQTVTCTEVCSKYTWCTCFSTCIVGCVAYTQNCGTYYCVTNTCTQTYCGGTEA
jgi:hypothetical protein